MGLSDIAAQSIGIPEPSARFLIALFSGKSLTFAAKPRRIHPCFTIYGCMLHYISEQRPLLALFS